jgi:hypothetical protein
VLVPKFQPANTYVASPAVTLERAAGRVNSEPNSALVGFGLGKVTVGAASLIVPAVKLMAGEIGLQNAYKVIFDVAIYGDPLTVVPAIFFQPPNV